MDRKDVGFGLALCLAGCALALPGRAAAEETKVLHKCVDAKGVTSIQAAACPKGSTEVWTRDAQTEPKQTAAEAAAAREREARNRQQVVAESAELQRRLAPQVAPAPPQTPPEGSHLAGATNPPEGSHRAPVAVEAPSVPQQATSCQAAQAFSTSIREKSWIGLNDDQMRRILAWVGEQCRVQPSLDD